VPSKKCEGTLPNSYPGVAFDSAIQTASGGCVVTGQERAHHTITISNHSLLPYRVDFESKCDYKYLAYLGCNPPENWTGVIDAPPRWEYGPRESSDSKELCVTATAAAARDRSVIVDIYCERRRGGSRSGPFQILLQIDTA